MFLQHLPIVLMAGGLIALFISLHTAGAAVSVVAGGHLLIGAVIAGARAWRQRTQTDDRVQR